MVETLGPTPTMVADGFDDALEEAFEALTDGNDRGEPLAAIYRLFASEIYGVALWRTGSREDAADVVQEVFVKLIGARDRLDGVRSPRAYLLAVAHRCAVDLVRRRRPQEPVRDSLLEPVSFDAERRLDAARVSSLIHRLPPTQRETVYLRTFAELSFREIGSVTGTSLFTAASRYRLGIARLRRLLRGAE